MNIHELTEALALHRKAWTLLNKSQHTGRVGPYPFDERLVATWSTVDVGLNWFEKNFEQLSADCRPSRAQLGAFASLVASFFATSLRPVRIRDRHGDRLRLVSHPTRDLAGGRKSKRALARLGANVEALRRFACEQLLAEDDLELTENLWAELRDEAAFSADLTLWTYAVELVRRTHYRSQGQAVHHLWLALPEEARTKLDALQFWDARQRVLSRLGALLTS